MQLTGAETGWQGGPMVRRARQTESCPVTMSFPHKCVVPHNYIVGPQGNLADLTPPLPDILLDPLSTVCQLPGLFRQFYSRPCQIVFNSGNMVGDLTPAAFDFNATDHHHEQTRPSIIMSKTRPFVLCSAALTYPRDGTHVITAQRNSGLPPTWDCPPPVRASPSLSLPSPATLASLS